MGEAKRRGAFEDRKAESLQRREDEKIRCAQAERKRLASMTEEEIRAERKRKEKARNLVATMAALGHVLPNGG